MPAPAGTYAARRAWALARLGHSRQDPVGRDWTPRTDVDDCALFQSAVVFGARSYACWNVDGFKSIGGGTYHRGGAGLRPGDVVLFDWDNNGVGNHTEMAETSADVAGNFKTLGANGRGTIAVAFRTQNTRNVLGYFRPSWPATPAPTPAPPAADTTPSQREDDMYILSNGKGQGLLTGGALVTIPSPDDVRALQRAGVPAVEVSSEFYNNLRAALG